jgi:hypothetical protein
MSHGYDDERKQFIFGDIQIIRQGQGPCIVCGHPTGDCATEHSAPHHIWGVTEVPSLEDTTMILVEEDVIQYRQITPFTKSKVLVARAGQKISVTRARELGIV